VGERGWAYPKEFDISTPRQLMKHRAILEVEAEGLRQSIKTANREQMNTIDWFTDQTAKPSRCAPNHFNILARSLHPLSMNNTDS